MAGRVTVRCSCGWGPERRRPTTIARGCPDCQRPLILPQAPSRSERTVRATVRLVESDMLELAPREHWGRELRKLAAAAAQAKRVARASSVKPPTH